MALCTPDEVVDIVNSFQPKASNFALFLIISSEDEELVCSFSEAEYNAKKHVIFGRNILHNDMYEYFSEYYALREISHNSSAFKR